MADMQLDPNSTQGVLQRLLGNYENDERKQLLERRDQAQQQQLDIMNMAPADSGPINRMVADYLQNYAKTYNPFASVAMAGANEAQRVEPMANNMLLRRQKAAEEEAKMAEEALKESDLFAKGLIGGAKGGATGKWIQSKDDQGNLMLYNNVTGQREVIPATQSPFWQKVYTASLDDAIKNKMENPHDYATEAANYAVTKTPGATTSQGAAQPLQVPIQRPQGGGITPNMPPLGLGAQPQVQAPGVPPTAISVPPGANKQTENLVMQQFAKALKLSENPETREEGIFQLQALSKLYPAALSPEQKQAMDSGVGVSTRSPTQPEQPPRPNYLNVRDEEYKKKYGSDEGAALLKERTNLTELAGKNSQLMNNLTMMEQMYSDPNIPEGTLGPLQQQYRSALKTFGLDTSSSISHAQVFDALAKKAALAGKNADGQNLLPGAMSNYEDQLLQSMAPGLAGTREGNKLLMRIMREFAVSNMRFATEASKLAEETNPEAPMLPPTWNKRKERIMKEEMLRLKRLSEELMPK